MLHIELWQWLLGSAAALLVGISKTGVPGAGILVVPLLAYVFGGRPSVGIMLPMLIFADCFAVAWYRRHAQWDKILKLLPWVIVGFLFGTTLLWTSGHSKSHKDIIGLIIGIIVLLMLALFLLQNRMHEQLTPKSKIGSAATGIAAGFTTMVSNAAGPIMTIYFTAHKMPKKEFIGTMAWYFFILNLTKLPVFIILSLKTPEKPIITIQSAYFVLAICPVILIGVFIGKWLLPRISQKVFERVVLTLAGTSAIKLVADYFLK